MAKVRTHYDNLQVSREASLEVIKAAYRTLSAKHHPDRNRGDAGSAGIMAGLNESYAVLSNEDSRREHDRWIRRQEAPRDSRPAHQPFAPAPSPRAHSESPPWSPTGGAAGEGHWSRSAQKSEAADAALREGKFGKLAALLASGLAACVLVAALLSEQRAGLRAAASNSLPAKPSVSGEALPARTAKTSAIPAPDGRPWPAAPGYFPGFPRLEEGGQSEVAIDNRNNSFAVFLKLAALNDGERRPIRHVYIPAFARFAMHSLPPGVYDISYMDLSDGSVARSEPFQLTEVKGADGVRFNNVTMTLFPVTNGGMVTRPVDASEF